MMRCSACDEDIDEDEDQVVEVIRNLNQHYCHMKCFKCSVCNELLTGLYLEKNGVLFCRKDYYNNYGERCQHCENFMSGPVMVVGGEIKFHPECFKCQLCSSIIGDDESYAYVDRSKLYCNLCFQKRTNQASADLETSVRFQKKRLDCNDTVQVIEIPPHSNGRQRRIKLALRDQSCGNLSNCICNCFSRKKIKINFSLSPNPLSDDDKILESNTNVQRAYCFNNNNCSITRVPTTNSNQLQNVTSHATSDDFVHISEIDVNYDLDFLHIGDKILEVNGVSIKDKSLKDIEKLIEKCRDEVIHLTVEHNHGNQSRASLCASSFSSSKLSDSIYSCNHSNDFNVDKNGSTLNNSGQKSTYCDNDSLDLKPSFYEQNELNKTSKQDLIEESNDLSSLSCYKLLNNEDSINSNCSDKTKSSFLTNKPFRSSSLIPSPNEDPICKYSPAAPAKSIEQSGKFRSLEKRHRNRERSSSLSRLLESIRISPDNSISDACDCSSSPFTTATNNSHINSSSYFIPSRNGLSSRMNNSLSRTKSFRVEPKSYRIFRACDLVKGSLLGRGFFGEVFEVTDKVTKEKMVLKELYHNDREAEANFVREVSILKSLSHKNVLHFIGILYRGKKLNLITEYITGGTLRQLIQDETHPINWLERINWARDIASGMNYLHSMNLIHRDLNSQNCLVREDGTVVVADFGLSKITSVNSSPEENNENDSFNKQQQSKLAKRRDRRKRYTIVGNPFWMAPEMMHRNKYDERVDIYSFGIVLLEIIGSVNADPDVLRRNRDFSVDKKYFLDNYIKKSCPESFWKIAFLCTEMNPDMRPAFHLLERWLTLISSFNLHHSPSVEIDCNKEYDLSIPNELLNEIINYNNITNTTNQNTNSITIASK